MTIINITIIIIVTIFISSFLLSSLSLSLKLLSQYHNHDYCKRRHYYNHWPCHIIGWNVISNAVWNYITIYHLEHHLKYHHPGTSKNLTIELNFYWIYLLVSGRIWFAGTRIRYTWVCLSESIKKTKSIRYSQEWVVTCSGSICRFLGHFHTQAPKNGKELPWKTFLYFRKWKFLAPKILLNFFYTVKLS